MHKHLCAMDRPFTALLHGDHPTCLPACLAACREAAQLARSLSELHGGLPALLSATAAQVPAAQAHLEPSAPAIASALFVAANEFAAADEEVEAAMSAELLLTGGPHWLPGCCAATWLLVVSFCGVIYRRALGEVDAGRVIRGALSACGHQSAKPANLCYMFALPACLPALQCASRPAA